MAKQATEACETSAQLQYVQTVFELQLISKTDPAALVWTRLPMSSANMMNLQKKWLINNNKRCL